MFEDDFRGWTRVEAPADPATVAEFAAVAPVELPEGYLDLLRRADGGEGPLGIEPGWFQLWPAGEVLALNRGYGVDEFAPGLFGFGSNGGGEMLAFDTRRGTRPPVVMVPLTGLDWDDAVEIAEDFETFARALGREAPRD